MHRTAYHITIDIRNRADKRGYQPQVDDSLCSTVFSATERALNLSSDIPLRGSFYKINPGDFAPKNINMIISILTPTKHLPIELDNLLGASTKNQQSLYEEMPIGSFREYIQANKSPFLRKQAVAPNKQIKQSIKSKMK